MKFLIQYKSPGWVDFHHSDFSTSCFEIEFIMFMCVIMPWLACDCQVFLWVIVFFIGG